MLAYHVAEGDGGIFLVGATGESPRRLTDKGFHPAWSPDNRNIAYCTERIVNPQSRNSISSLWVVDQNGGAPRRISAGDAMQPAWSPSGRRIAYWANSGGQRDLFTIPAAGGIPTPVLSDAPLDWCPAWSPDGRYLYFASDRGGSMNLWRVPVDEASGRALGPPETVTNGVQASTELPSLSSDGSKLVFRARLQSANPVAIPFDPAAERLGDPVPLFRRTGILEPFDISRDGQWLALDNEGERQEDIFICRTDGSDLRRVTDDFYRDRSPAWSPDGKRIAFYSNRSGRYEIWEIGRDGGGLKKLSDYKEDNLYCPVFSPPGDRMVACARFMVYEVLMFDPRRPWAEQQPLKLPLEVPGGILNPMKWSPDGLRLAGSLALKAGSAMGLGVYDFATKKVRILDKDTPSSYVAWLPDSRRVIAMMGDDNHPVLFDVETGRRRELPVKGSGWMFTGGVVVAPDGRTVFAASRQVESDVWMVERSRTSAPNRGR
jgi:Tol biopolymer transport system component